MTADTAQLRKLRQNATKGLWELQDGCSWRRIGTRGRDGDVLCPTNSRSDGHPDLMAGRGEDTYANLELIVAAVNSLPALLDELDRLRAVAKFADHKTVCRLHRRLGSVDCTCGLEAARARQALEPRHDA